jgi:hypothetical protein
LVLKRLEGDRHYFQTQNDSASSDSAAAAGDSATDAGGSTAAGGSAAGVGELFSQGPPVDPTTRLPSSIAVIGPGALEGGGVGTAIGAANGPSGNRGIGGRARTGMFGVQGEGYKFVYVLDRSGSMGGPGRETLGAAKAQLLGSLQSLDKTHQFQIIFYNDRPERFSPSGNPNKLCFATEQNKAMAAKFIGGIVAHGQTEHEAALVAAIKLRPDVIFFLTDADLPVLGTGSLEKIHRMAGGITIHTVEFGLGPQSDPNNFLVRLARENGGNHGYVDVWKLFPVQSP